MKICYETTGDSTEMLLNYIKKNKLPVTPTFFRNLICRCYNPAELNKLENYIAENFKVHLDSEEILLGKIEILNQPAMAKKPFPAQRIAWEITETLRYTDKTYSLNMWNELIKGIRNMKSFIKNVNLKNTKDGKNLKEKIADFNKRQNQLEGYLKLRLKHSLGRDEIDLPRKLTRSVK